MLCHTGGAPNLDNVEMSCVTQLSGTEHVAGRHSAAPRPCGKLAEICPDEMSCLLMNVSLRGQALFSALPLHIRLLITVTQAKPSKYASQYQHIQATLRGTMLHLQWFQN